MDIDLDPAADFRAACAKKSFACILADPPWQFQNRTGKVAAEHRRLTRYGTMTLPEICRWVVERSFAWLGRCRRLAKDWETTIASSAAWLRLASIRRMVRAVARA